MQQPQAILTFSDQMYQRFLHAYPVEYRQGFSEEMAQVFRDLCREIYEREGLVGFLELWLTTLFDLIKTAFEERFKEATHMTKEKFVRLSGWALMLGGVTFVLGFAAGGGKRLSAIHWADRTRSTSTVNLSSSRPRFYFSRWVCWDYDHATALRWEVSAASAWQLAQSAAVSVSWER